MSYLEAEDTLCIVSQIPKPVMPQIVMAAKPGIFRPLRGQRSSLRGECTASRMAKCTLTFQSTSLQLPIPRPRPWTGQLPPCHPCALRHLHPACPAPASDPAPWRPHSTASSPQHRCVPGQPSLSHQQPPPSHPPTSVQPTSAGRSEGHPSAACLHPAPSTRATNQMTRKTKR